MILNPAIPILAAEWRIIEPILAENAAVQRRLQDVIAIIAARAGKEGVTYGLSIDQRALVETYTRAQMDELLKQKITKQDLANAGFTEAIPHGE